MQSIFPNMQKENIKSKNYNTLKRVGILFVFFFTLFSFGKNVYGAGEIWSVTNTPDNYMGGINEVVPQASTNGTIYSFDYYGGWEWSSGHGGDTVQYVLWEKNSGGSWITQKDCSSVEQTATAWGLPFYPSKVSMHVVMSETECTISSGDYFGFRVWKNGSGWSPTDAQAWGTGSTINDIYLLVNGVPDIPPDFSSRIDTFTYATSTQTVNITGYWNIPSDPFVSETLEFYQESTALGRESFVSVSATTTGAFNFTFPYKILPTPGGATTTAPILETIYFHAKLYSVDSNYYDPFGLGGLDTSLYKTLLDSASATLTELTHDLDLPIGLLEYPEYECAITSITGCLKNAGIWLFYPSSQKIDQFKSLSSDLQTKFPFAYAYGVNQMRQELFSASSTPQTISLTFKIIPGHGTSTLELISQSKLSAVPYANTVKTILGWILWLLAIEYIYYRVIRAHDPNTPS